MYNDHVEIMNIEVHQIGRTARNFGNQFRKAQLPHLLSLTDSQIGKYRITRENGDAVLLHLMYASEFSMKDLERFIQIHVCDKPKPIIILEKADSCTCQTTAILKHPYIKGVIRNSVFRDTAMNNYPRYDGRFIHEGLLDVFYNENEATSSNNKILGPEEIGKIKPGWGYQCYRSFPKHVYMLKKKEVDLDSRRDIDVHFFGKTHYEEEGKEFSGRWISKHREDCLNAVRKLPSKIRVDADKHKQYGSFLQNVKVVISPWGYGEMCKRDYEAWLAGCVLIKPSCDFVLTWPDTYKSYENYIPCKYDFSDLEEKVEYTLEKWDELYDIRFTTRKTIIDRADNTDKFRQRIVDLLDSLLT